MLKEIVKEIKKAQKIAVFHHVHPDGDSISSSYGLLLAIKSKFPNKEVVFVADIDEIKVLFPHWDIESSAVVPSIDASFITIVGDAAIKNRIAHFDEYAKGYKKIVFDHHKVPEKPDFDCDIYWREDSFIASAMQANLIAKALKVKLNQKIAFSLMIGLITDSGQFTFSANDSRVVEMYANLIKYISKERMIQFYNDFKRKSKKDIELQKEILAAIKYSPSTSYVVFKKPFIKKHGRENIKAKLGVIGNIEDHPTWAMFLEREEQTDGYLYDVSLRSSMYSILGIAKKYDGGGHEKASGCKIKSEKDIQKIIKELDALNIY